MAVEQRNKAWYVCILKAFPRYPYIAAVYASSKTAASKLFLEYLDAGNFRLKRKTISAVEAILVSTKRSKSFASGKSGYVVLGFEFEEESADENADDSDSKSAEIVLAAA